MDGYFLTNTGGLALRQPFAITNPLILMETAIYSPTTEDDWTENSQAIPEPIDLLRTTKAQAEALGLDNARPFHPFNRPKAALHPHILNLMEGWEDEPGRRPAPLPPTARAQPSQSSPQGTVSSWGGARRKPDHEAELDLLGRLIAELACTGCQWLSYSRKNEWYALRSKFGMLPLSCTRKRMVRLVDRLRAAGLVDHVRGYKLKGYGYQSLLRPSTAFLRWLEAIGKPAEELYAPDPAAPPVIVKDEKGNPVLPTDQRAFEVACRDVLALREWMRSFVIAAPAQPGNYELWQGFNSAEMDKGGRYYGWWQNLTKLERLAIRLNGEPVAELDFKTLHPTFLYHQRGLHPPENAYTVDGFTRDLVKATFNRMLNSKNLDGTRRALAEEIGSRERADMLIDSLLAIHAPLAADGVFGSGIGLELMRQDAKIAIQVMKWASWTRTPMLPVHDSFIVRQCDAEACEEHMSLTYHAYFGIRPAIVQTAPTLVVSTSKGG